MKKGGGITPRFLALVLLAGAVATLVGGSHPNFALLSEVSIWIYSLLVAFLIDKALLRRNDLKQNMNIELARLRHIHHIGEQFGSTFSKAIDKHLSTYQKTLGKQFRDYVDANREFRALSHTIYGFTPKNRKQELLFADLLETLQELTLGRQRIQYALNNHLSWYYWFLILLALSGLLTLLFVPTANLTPTRQFLLSWLTIFITFIPLEMLFKSDQYSAASLENYQHLYLRNTPEKLKE